MAGVAAAQDALTGALGDLGARCVLHWGEMAARWGVSRTVAQIQALLYLRARPLHAEAIAATLQVARSNVSTSLRELLNWNLARVVHLPGDRRDHYETPLDPWELLRIVARERRKRELRPTLAFLSECVSSRGFAREDAATQKRLRETLAMLAAMDSWADDMLGMDAAMLKRLVKLGARGRT